jgi:4-hydroxy-tetrahydrodipicolinate synthase
MTWRGIFPSIPTAFTPNGAIDPEAQRRIVRFAVDRGSHGLLCFGLAGEVARLTPDERKRLCEVILEEVNGAIPVLVGASAESEHHARDLARHAEAGGAAGIVLPVPGGGAVSGSVLLEYFEQIAGSVGVPVMIQDAPEYLGVAIGPQLVRELASRVPQVSYVKLEIGPQGVTEWLTELEGSAAIFGGNGGVYLLDCIRAGAVGIAPALDTVDVLVAIYEAEAANDRERADALFRETLPMLVFEMQGIDHCNLCAKYVLAHRGVALETCLRAPAPHLAPEAAALLDAYLASLPLDELAVTG